MKSFILIAAFAVLGCFCTDVNAASMFGRVIDVGSGDVITVFNLNRPVRVRLLGVDAPEMDQAFGDVARKHLSDLIHNKNVVVEYSGIAADRSVAGRVLLHDADIGAQMIRDGVAWVDPSNLNRLSAMDQQIYQQSEQAARSERRGLWQAANPMAPWEFVKAQALRLDPRATLNALAPAQKKRSDRGYSELTNLTLMTRGAASMTSTNRKDFAWAETIPTKSDWHRFRPAGEDFSALVPQNGKQFDAEVPVDGEMGNVTIYVGRDGWSTYLVQWLRTETRGESHREVLDNGMAGFATGMNRTLGPYGNSSCQLTNEKYISVVGLPAVEFELASCALSGRARIVTKLVNGQRQVYVLAALYINEDDNVSRFLNSLSVDQPKSRPRRK
jgi:endonuclease YncB( thermonuclease family)